MQLRLGLVLLALCLAWACAFVFTSASQPARVSLLPTLAAHRPLATKSKQRLTRLHLQPLVIGYPNEEYQRDNQSHIYGYGVPNHRPSDFQRLVLQRVTDWEANRANNTQARFARMVTALDRKLGYPMNVYDGILSKEPDMAFMTEFKRASPEVSPYSPAALARKCCVLTNLVPDADDILHGPINLEVDAVEKCIEFAEGGAAIICVHTEPNVYKGSLEEMQRIRMELQRKYMNKRPVIARADFIFDRAQITESRAYGADTVILLASMLGSYQLMDLIIFSRINGFEPIVEVTNEQEMLLAIEQFAKVVSINSRNPHTLEVDSGLTKHLTAVATSTAPMWARRGNLVLMSRDPVTSPDEAEAKKRVRVSCCTTDDLMMESPKARLALQNLLTRSRALAAARREKKRLLVKVSGLVRTEDVGVALSAGASMIGINFIPMEKRRVYRINAKDIVKQVREYGGRKITPPYEEMFNHTAWASKPPKTWLRKWMDTVSQYAYRRPLVVGTFKDQPLEEVNEQIVKMKLDMVQLEGDEQPEYIRQLRAPAIKTLHVTPDTNYDELKATIQGFAKSAVMIRLDTPGRNQTDGASEAFDWSIAQKLQAEGIPVIVAGGLNPKNVKDVVEQTKTAGVDVSHGVEQDTIIFKDAMRVIDFVREARLASFGPIEQIVYQDIVEGAPADAAAGNETEAAEQGESPDTAATLATTVPASDAPVAVEAQAETGEPSQSAATAASA